MWSAGLQGIDHVAGTADAILVESPAPIGACKPCVAAALQFRPALLCAHCSVVVYRVRVMQGPQHLGRIDCLAAVEGHYQGMSPGRPCSRFMQ